MNRPQALRLATGQLLPDLRIIAASEIAVHEDSDPVRVGRLVTRLREDGVLRNPPVAAPLPDGGYIVLDGANRTSALTALGISAIPLQVVDYGDHTVRLEVWRHFVVDAPDLLQRLSTAGLTLERVQERDADRILSTQALACYLVTDEGTVGIRPGPGPLGATLARAVGVYRGAARIYRVQGTDRDELVREYGADGTLVVFPTFTKTDIVSIARAEVKLPTGITRHIISGRALRLNLPLSALAAPGEIVEKNRWLADLIRQKLLDNRIRYYPEATFLFDE
ncbi:MAG: hypothetical protein HYU65_02880 [Armatimonadetes bacterium]|nr:hypothetical protein [Armatimonadota bacterium]